MLYYNHQVFMEQKHSALRRRERFFQQKLKSIKKFREYSSLFCVFCMFVLVYICVQVYVQLQHNKSDHEIWKTRLKLLKFKILEIGDWVNLCKLHFLLFFFKHKICWNLRCAAGFLGWYYNNLFYFFSCHKVIFLKIKNWKISEYVTN